MARSVMMGKSKKLKWDVNATGFQIEIKTTSKNQNFTLPLVNPTTMGTGTGYNCIVRWGDNTADTLITTYNQATATHNFSAIGTYTIHIQGQCDGWSFSNAGSRTLVSKILNWGDYSFAGFCYLYQGFYGCSNITTMPNNGNIKQILPNLNMTGVFRSCTKLTNISVGLFDKLIDVTNYSYCFYGCTSIATLPSNLFYYSKYVTNYSYCFYGCNKLQFRIDLYNYGNFINKSINFAYCFYRTSFTGNKGTAPELWNANYGTGVPTKTYCFAGAGNSSSTSIDNYASIPIAWR